MNDFCLKYGSTILKPLRCMNVMVLEQYVVNQPFIKTAATLLLWSCIMPKRHYIRLYKVFQHSKLLKLQIQVLFVSTFVDWVLMPYIAKLEGTYLPVMMISFFMLIGASDGFVQPLFKKVKIYNIYLFVVLLDFIQIASYSVSNINIIYFTYLILFIFTFQSITFEISRVHTIDFMKDEIDLKEYLMLRSLIVSSAIIGGASSAMILDYFDIALQTTLIGLGAMGIYAIIIELRLYFAFKKVVQEGETVIEKEHSRLENRFHP